MKIKITINIPGWLEQPIVFFVLLYRWLRYGYAFRRIPLTQGKFAIVDPENYPRLARYKWYAAKNRETFYAVRCQWFKAAKMKLSIKMHRLIIHVPEELVIDHINHNGLDNRKANLRLATPADNAKNARHLRTNTSSKYKGVWFNRQTNKWRAAIKYNGRRKQLGYFDNEIKAAKAYDEAARKYHGEFAYLNFPEHKTFS